MSGEYMEWRRSTAGMRASAIKRRPWWKEVIGEDCVGGPELRCPQTEDREFAEGYLDWLYALRDRRLNGRGEV